MTTDTGLQPLIVGINAAWPSIAAIFVVLRLYSRHFITRNLGWDDSLIVIAMIMSIAMAVTGHLAIMAAYVGYHFKDAMELEQHPVLVKKYNYASQMLYGPILAFVKNAVLIFFLRLGKTFDGVRLFIISLLIINNLMMVAIFLTAMFQCMPISKIFHEDIPGHCINSPPFFIAASALMTLTDIFILIIPTWLLWDLKMKPRKKIATIFLLSLGFLVTGISVYRLYYLISFYYGTPNPDPTYSISGTASATEVNMAIITACGPFMKPLIVRFLPSFFERDTTNDHASDWPDSVAFYEDRLRSYSASATAGKLGSAFGSDVELQGPGGRSLKSGRYGRPLEAWGEEDDDYYYDDVSSPKRRTSATSSMEITERGSGTSEEVDHRPQAGRERPGITRHVTVHITYSPSKRHHSGEV